MKTFTLTLTAVILAAGSAAAEDEERVIRELAPVSEFAGGGLYEIINYDTKTIVYLYLQQGKEPALQVIPFGLIGGDEEPFPNPEN